jgi:predicted DNA-binding transcriptional regulator AlpA
MPVKKKKKPPRAPTLSEFIDRLEVAAMIQVQPQTVGDWVLKKKFPPPIVFSQRLQRWRRQTVLDFLARLEREGGAA